MIDYKIKNATQKDLYLHLEKCSDSFIPPLQQTVNIKDYSQKLADKSKTFEAWENQELIGVIAAYFNNIDSKTGFITNVSVLEQYNNKGIARMLMEMTKSYAIAHGFDKISLEVNPNNTKAIVFYKKNDFRIDMKNGASVFMQLLIKK